MNFELIPLSSLLDEHIMMIIQNTEIYEYVYKMYILLKQSSYFIRIYIFCVYKEITSHAGWLPNNDWQSY